MRNKSGKWTAMFGVPALAGFVAVVCLLAAPAPLCLAAEPLTYVDLIERLTDLERLALLPEPGNTCRQWSSYDRASKYDEAAGKYVKWDANGDGGGCIRREGDSFVMAEMEGPGCIWRIWSADPQQGHVRIYLDGAEKPAADLPFRGYFDCKNAPFTRPALVYTAAKGWNNYTPIPYQKSCKIVADKGWGRYFQFVYETFPDGTQLPTFKRELTDEENAALDAANGLLLCPETMSDGQVVLGGTQIPERRHSAPCETLKFAQKIEPGSTAVLADLAGPRAITQLLVQTALPAPEDLAILRHLILKITWDGESRPAVWAPLGDFFGTAPGANAYHSFPMGLTKDGVWYSNWYMPFEKSGHVEITNDGDKGCTVQASILHAPLTEPIERLARFHAKWHLDAFLPPEPERWIDWTILNTQGRGRFCGVALHVWNPKGGWWGEGDEKFFVDGEKFPSTIGTGSEDYFGYAWCTPQLFNRAYHNQTRVNGNIGHVSVNRWQIADNIPFQKSFEGYIEKYYPNKKPTLYDAVAYWYLAPGGNDPYGPAPADKRMVWPEPEIPHVKGALEGEKMEVLSKTGGNLSMQDMLTFGEGWSGLGHLWWTDAKPGDRLDLCLPVVETGAYRLKIQLTKAVDYAIVQLSLDGKNLGDPLDLYNNGVVPTGELDLGRQQLEAGDHVLTAEIAGANPAAVKSYMAGIDYVKLESAPE